MGFIYCVSRDIYQFIVSKLSLAHVKFFSHPNPPYNSKQCLNINIVVSIF